MLRGAGKGLGEEAHRSKSMPGANKTHGNLDKDLQQGPQLDRLREGKILGLRRNQVIRRLAEPTSPAVRAAGREWRSREGSWVVGRGTHGAGGTWLGAPGHPRGSSRSPRFPGLQKAGTL